jgi:hypothetical protein
MRAFVFVAGFAIVLSACDEPRSAADQPRLHLEEEFAITLPDSSPLLGVAGEHAGNLVAWSQSGAFLLSATSPPQRVRVTLSGVPAGGSFAGPGVVEILDPAGAQVRRTTGEAELPGKALRPGLGLVDAVRTDEFGWVVAGLEHRGRLSIQALDGSSWWVIEADTLPGGVLRPYRLGLARRSVLLTEAEPPFRTWRIGPDGPGVPFAPRGSGYPESAGIQRWVSAPVVDLGDALLQTLSDLGSDRRLLILYDRHGREQRKTVIAVPMAFVGVTRDRRHLIGVRDVGRPEVVLYRWSWSTNLNKGRER